jgi:Leucine-rich repeat (LRR) protein
MVSLVVQLVGYCLSSIYLLTGTLSYLDVTRCRLLYLTCVVNYLSVRYLPLSNPPPSIGWLRD